MTNQPNTTREFLPEFPMARLKRATPSLTIKSILKSSLIIAAIFSLFLSFQRIMWILVGNISSLNRIPFHHVKHAYDRLNQNHKQTKARMRIAAVLTGLLIGAFLSPILLAQVPQYTIAIETFIKLFSTSLTVSIAVGVATPYILRFMGFGNTALQISMTLMPFVFLYNPIHIPLQYESLFISATLTALICSEATKQAMRVYNWLRYGDTNADGYAINKSKEEIDQMHQQIADKFNQSRDASAPAVTREDVAKFLEVTKKGARAVKENRSMGNMITGSYLQLTEAFKNLYHGVREINAENFSEVQDMLKASVSTAQQKDHRDTTGSFAGIQEMLKESFSPEQQKTSRDTTANKPNPYSKLASAESIAHIKSDRELHTLFHQQGLEAGISKLKNKNGYTHFDQELAEACSKLINEPKVETKTQPAVAACAVPPQTAPQQATTTAQPEPRTRETTEQQEVRHIEERRQLLSRKCRYPGR